MFSGCAVQTDEDGCKSGGCSSGEFPRTKAKVTVQALIGGDGGEEPKGGKMADRDFFHDIAMTKHPFGSTDKEVEPVPVPDLYFQRGNQTAARKEAFSFEDQCKHFHKELEEMRERFRPFLADYLPGIRETVEREELRSFRFRYLEKGEVFTERHARDKEWENVTIPDYRGPAEERGKWSGYYCCTFRGKSREEFAAAGEDSKGTDFHGTNSCGADSHGKESHGRDSGRPDFHGTRLGRRAVLAFQCVDYIAQVYVNGCFVGSHEGFFAPFSFDITDYLREENELVILCKNDIPTLGTGPVLDGDKLYAATGPGWDDPVTGWHHCPAGAGIFGRVTLEYRPEVYIEDIFVRPDIDTDSAQVRVGICNYMDQVLEDYGLEMNFLPRNYEGEKIGSLSTHISCVGPGKNEYRYYVPLSGYRLWDMEHPWLYGATAELFREGELISGRKVNFGMKKFISDESSVPRGKFYLNNEPIVLRGANEMGHLQQCVMKGDYAQLIDDILIAKLCHMNYYRVTQRPVQEEIYDYFDMLGIMHQCDLPLFGFLRRPQFAEAVRQAEEMEHLIRGHVSTCMVTFINEPMCIRRTSDPNDKYSRRYEVKGHRHLLRDELEAFFAAARKAIYVQNPDRVIKNVEGDYDAPTGEGMPDFHCYTMWYTNHGEPIGRLMRGYLPPVKEGWMIGCGEYGAEGLDNEAVMRKYYPGEWLAEDGEGNWYPDKIVRAQTHSVQGDWYEEQKSLSDWVRESQIHQANATRLMTDALRRRGDVVNHTAIHLLIDAWPAGWMKTLLDCEREPKRAYFAYRDSLVPLRVNLYTGYSCVYEDQQIDVEGWLLNDTGKETEVTILASLWEEGEEKPYADFALKTKSRPADAFCAGKIPVSFRRAGGKKEIRRVILSATLVNSAGEVLNQEEISFLVYDRATEAPVRAAGQETVDAPVKGVGREAADVPVKVAGQEAANVSVRAVGQEAEKVCRLLGIPCGGEDVSSMVVSSLEQGDLDALTAFAEKGGRGILLLPERGADLSFNGTAVREKGCGDLFFAAALPEWRGYPISMVYNERKGYIDATAVSTIDTALPGEDLIYTYDKSGFDGSRGAKLHLPFVKECPMGEGMLILISLCREGRLGVNAGLDALFTRLIIG